MKKLLVISSAPSKAAGDDLFLDVKFCNGMKYYCDSWQGAVDCVLMGRNSRVSFGRAFRREELPFAVHILAGANEMDREFLSQFDVILCSGDNFEFLNLAETCAPLDVKIAFIIEYTPETRRQIIELDRSRSLPKKIYSLLWTLRQERRRRRAFRIADGLQANGYPAMEVYGPLNNNTLLYLDNRIGSALLANESEMANRRDRLRSGATVRLLHSGRLETMKGAQDLVPIAKRLTENGVPFELDIFGTGSLADEIAAEIKSANLEGRVRLHAPVDFETELVPFARRNADIFLSCHRQSDPSCSYLENMGCGLPIAGYSNEMWKSLHDASRAGWIAPLGNWKSLADMISATAGRRDEIIEMSDRALDFSSRHCFEVEFQRRIDHLESMVQ